ncbi:LysM peptidoglycan-binding domain-containing protein [Streptomyces cavernae]|uniref:LysM peptidoglycan-binding domain-containing protein n=1 Tax=Streptomyces cavernae TaxID=2259034 RepID=UPI000FEBC670|nr:LysM peptidoglycan-binding domain-containing protein [Streptomyces cavernae]
MAKRKRSSAHAAAAAAAAVSLVTVTGLIAGQAQGTPGEEASRSQPITGANGSSAHGSDRAPGLAPADGPAKRRPARSTAHTVVTGDTLWDIAERHFGDGLQWTTIYDHNERTIEDEARRHEYASSDHGNWIFPGTVLTLPQKANRPKAHDETSRPGEHGDHRGEHGDHRGEHGDRPGQPGGRPGQPGDRPGQPGDRPGEPGPVAVRAALAKLQQNIRDYVAQNGSTYTFTSYVGATTGNIVLNTSAPANVLSQLTDLPGAPESEVRAIRDMQVNRATVRELSRLDDRPPFKGGAGIFVGIKDCSSGYAVKKRANGAIYMVTAGHCGPDGTEARTKLLRPYGKVSDVRLPPRYPMDMALLGGQEYTGRIFTGGIFSDTTVPVVGAGPIGSEEFYCYSGATTGESCGHRLVQDSPFQLAAGQSCAEEGNGCVSPVLVFTGENASLPRGGDSGGPFYTKDHNGNAIIRGHVIQGGKTPDGRFEFGVAEPWPVVAAELGVDIVTSPPE